MRKEHQYSEKAEDCISLMLTPEFREVISFSLNFSVFVSYNN